MSNSNLNLVLEIKDLSFSYSKKNNVTPIINNVNLSVSSGERIGIIGANGSGKSTFSKLLLGIFKPDKGAIFLNGTKVRWRRHYPNVGYVGDPGHNAQELGLPTQYTIQQVISTLCSLYQSKGVLNTANELLDKLGLSGMKHRRISNLSTGERKRLMVCLTFIKVPDFIILDEPFDGLDAHIITYVKSLLFEALQNKDLTIFFISHSKIEIDTFTSQVYRMHEGKLYKEPQNYFEGKMDIDGVSNSFRENTGQVMDRILGILESGSKFTNAAFHLKADKSN